MNISLTRKRTLEAGVALPALVLMSAAFAAPAFAQQTTPSPTVNTEQSNQVATDVTAGSPPAGDANGRIIVVTGSLVRNPATATASPVVSVTADDLTKRGITTVAEALQTLPANNQGTAPPSWSSFGFATGASAPSLRGLNDAYTLTLFDGMRSAPYPLGDDGYRNFVDINTIPSSIVDRIDVLQDGASATYGSDAIAGVVNVIIKREIQGIHMNASAGLSQRQDAGDRYVSLTAGYGDLQSQGFNVYINGEYQYTDGLRLSSSNRTTSEGYPIATFDQSMICRGAGNCLTNQIRNGIQAGGGYNGFQSTIVPYLRPYAANPLTGAPVASAGGYQLANPGAGCNGLTPITLTAAQRAGTITPATVCQQSLAGDYRYYNSPTERKGANMRATFKLGDNTEAYMMFNYYNTTTKNAITPAGYTGQTAAGGQQVTVSGIYLPVYVCSAGTGAFTGNFTGNLYATGCNATNGTLNPNNPFAATGNLARLVALPPFPRDTIANTQTYRISAGVDGSFWNGFNYSLAATGSMVTLDRTDDGYIYLQGLMDAVAKGTFNFDNPYANTQSQIQGVFPTSKNHSYSKLFQVMATVNKDLFTLPGGELNVAVAGQYRYEAINNPSSNAANNADPYLRYFSLNGVGVEGSRHVYSASYQVTAPILHSLKVQAEGSYDKYSTGQSRFSPKFEATFQPIDLIKIRGTYSRGFRIPSFSESFALPTTGYVTQNINCGNAAYTAFCAAHANNTSYYSGGYSYGLTSAGNLNLAPEKSEGLTAGIVLQPTRRIALTADYWSVKLTNVIVPTTVTAAIINQYYSNNGVVNVPGITVTPGIPDQANPNALPLLGFVTGSYNNADSYIARGLDFSASGVFNITPTIQWRTKATASMLLKLQQTQADGSVLRYDASLGACNITSCSGAPKWRGVWQNTLDFNHKASVTLTANYTSGFSEVATDSGGTYGNCQQSTTDGQIIGYPDGTPVICNEKRTLYFDGHLETTLFDKVTLYGDIRNILDTKADFTPNAAYGLYNFNPAWQDSLFIGRYFRIGAKVDF